MFSPKSPKPPKPQTEQFIHLGSGIDPQTVLKQLKDQAHALNDQIKIYDGDEPEWKKRNNEIEGMDEKALRNFIVEFPRQIPAAKIKATSRVDALNVEAMALCDDINNLGLTEGHEDRLEKVQELYFNTKNLKNPDVFKKAFNELEVYTKTLLTGLYQQLHEKYKAAEQLIQTVANLETDPTRRAKIIKDRNDELQSMKNLSTDLERLKTFTNTLKSLAGLPLDEEKKTEAPKSASTPVAAADPEVKHADAEKDQIFKILKKHKKWFTHSSRKKFDRMKQQGTEFCPYQRAILLPTIEKLSKEASVIINQLQKIDPERNQERLDIVHFLVSKAREKLRNSDDMENFFELKFYVEYVLPAMRQQFRKLDPDLDALLKEKDTQQLEEIVEKGITILQELSKYLNVEKGLRKLGSLRSTAQLSIDSDKALNLEKLEKFVNEKQTTLNMARFEALKIEAREYIIELVKAAPINKQDEALAKRENILNSKRNIQELEIYVKELKEQVNQKKELEQRNANAGKKETSFLSSLFGSSSPKSPVKPESKPDQNPGPAASPRRGSKGSE